MDIGPSQLDWNENVVAVNCSGKDANLGGKMDGLDNHNDIHELIERS